MSGKHQKTPETVFLSAECLRRAAIEQLTACGLSLPHATLVADSLVQTSLWGIDSHGITLLPHYLRRLKAGSIKAKPRIRFTGTGPCTGTLDGGHGLGMVVCQRAMHEAILLAKSNGVGIVGCYHSTHCGAIGLYGRQAAQAGLIGIAFTHSDAFVAPHRGKRAFLGTNPICMAVPSESGLPVCLDMATSATTMNRLLNARREGEPVNQGVGLDDRGQPTTDAKAVHTLLPLAEHKGYALAFLIDILCGPLNGMPFGPHIPAMYGDLSARRYLGSLMMAIDPQRFAGGQTLPAVVAEMALEARQEPSVSATDEVLVPGDPEYRTEQVRARKGIPIPAGLYQELLGNGRRPNYRPAPRKITHRIVENRNRERTAVNRNRI